ncbi:hypothetical protein CEXT_164511 [Caerostris extrusa]|uniref:Uncharacterized protein n=1 Tax=Caerostris extrusa TaxID=172846 RepID=A0AAV4P2N4_CAEEX|nr:hypothetical protein CEXT_164511 [Caerostris extrusa]
MAILGAGMQENTDMLNISVNTLAVGLFYCSCCKGQVAVEEDAVLFECASRTGMVLQEEGLCSSEQLFSYKKEFVPYN